MQDTEPISTCIWQGMYCRGTGSSVGDGFHSWNRISSIRNFTDYNSAIPCSISCSYYFLMKKECFVICIAVDLELPR